MVVQGSRTPQPRQEQDGLFSAGGKKEQRTINVRCSLALVIPFYIYGNIGIMAIGSSVLLRAGGITINSEIA